MQSSPLVPDSATLHLVDEPCSFSHEPLELGMPIEPAAHLAELPSASSH
ncbi:MAG: hypothetical protein QOH97_4906 [Actinoplanes sp.]|nr:hypothetical protein [Actinoplanes sp.]